MNKKEMLEKLKNGRNISFDFFKKVLLEFGFEYITTEGSHSKYKLEKHKIIIVIQPHWKKKGRAKDYQVKEFLKYVKDYNLL
jgi:predicted RNA binding protein YcfA (HicA-like mRNA interferase family)